MILRLIICIIRLKTKEIGEQNMANIALIIAGGVGARMGQDIPKQFINVHDKPVMYHAYFTGHIKNGVNSL